MFERSSLRWPITLGVLMIVTIVALTVGWVFMTVVGALSDAQRATFFWTWLPIGAAMLVFILVGVVLYLTLSVKAINLTRRQSNFIDSVTHELKSPIASLKLYLQTLNRRNVSAEEREAFYKFMLEDVERLDTLISNLLDVARLDRGDQAGEPEEVPLEGVLRECAAAACVRHNVPPSAITLEIEPCVVIARQVELEMIFRNLIDNAIKYGADEPHVDVRASITPGRRAGQELAIVEVSDNGRGVPVARRREIFGRFVRLGHELEREKPGIGLGLYIVRSLIDRLRGRIRVVDRREGAGATFEVQLACQRVAGPKAEPSPAPSERVSV
jgi:two-component system, OmpR family, phosphate regulon sensor histidine kinase PhoR